MPDKISILVIDDKKIIGDLFNFTLGYTGHHITVVDTAKTAIEAMRRQTFDIAFLDIVMPGQDGVEMLKEIRELFPALPIVMMSGYSVEEKKIQAQELGAATCLKKPFEIEDVKKVIKETIGKDI